MRCYYKASNETEQKTIDRLNNKCVELNEKLNQVQMSDIVLYFNEIIAQENSTLILWKLAQELKVCGGKYTLEILWREALLSNKYNYDRNNNETNRFGEEFSNSFSKCAGRGEPFELIDGDNLRFFNQDINSLLYDFYESHPNLVDTGSKKKKRPPIVISIFGPQSSGKSTLLNYCFGCKFLTSAGRCTKGVYASLSKLSQPINHSDHFLILDTEGLDSIEKGKVLKETSCIEFDRTMVLFCLAVSQVVIINVKGEIGEELRNLLQICAYSLTKLKVSKVAAPNIFFVLNQQADPDPQKHLISITTLLKDLNKESYLMETEGMKISDLIQVSKDNLFVLPSAFNSVSVNTQMAKLFDCDLNKLSPTSSFANKCADLRMSIIHQLKFNNGTENQMLFNSMSEWMEMSGIIWDTIVKYQDIVKYRNVLELKCSISLSKIVNDLLKNKIYYNKDEYRQITENLLKIIKEISSWSPLQVILEDLKRELDDAFKKYQDEALNSFTELCQTDPLLKRMNYMCDDARSNLSRLVYMEKKIYEDKLRFEIKAILTEIKLSENMLKFQEIIEKNADHYLEVDIEQQKVEFDKLWGNILGTEGKKEEDFEREEMFDNLYSVFRIESKTMENKQCVYSLFRDADFDMDKILVKIREEKLAKFCDESKVFAGTGQFLYPWKENKLPIKLMTPYTGKKECEYLSQKSLWSSLQSQRKRHGSRTKVTFQSWVPANCHSLIQYCSGYYNHPDITWNPEKRKQILLLASQLRDPNDPNRSSWEKFIDDISEHVTKFIMNDPSISHSTVKEIVNFLCYACRVMNYEINFIEAKLTNAAERRISTYAFAFAFKSILEPETKKQKAKKSEEDKKKQINLKYFLQKVENRKMSRGNWDRKEMRTGDRVFAEKFAEDFVGAVWRSVNTTCEQNLYESYFTHKVESLSHKNLLILANSKITEEIDGNWCTFQTDPEDYFVVQFICNQTETLKNLFLEEWSKVTDELYEIIFKDMEAEFTKQIAPIQLILTELIKRMTSLCKDLERPEGIGLDSDSNFVVFREDSTEESTSKPDPRSKEAPFKAMVRFLEMWLNPKVSSEEFGQFFNNPFEIDGVILQKSSKTYVLYEKQNDPTHVLDDKIFKKLIGIKMFSCNETIFNIKVYIEAFLHILTNHTFQFSHHDYEQLLKSTKERFESRVINCPYQCPSCGKFCEREIHPHEGKCQVMTGHQLCSMGGKVWNTNEDRTAILLMCEDYDDDTQVLIPYQQMTWGEFKENCGDQWEWTLPKDNQYINLQKENREKMKNIWNIFGQKILEYYAKKDIHINYIPYTSPEDIYESLFKRKSYVCFVIDGTELMGSTIKHVKRWVADNMSELEEDSYFKVIIYHGHCIWGKWVEKFPNNSDFTSDKEIIHNYLENIKTYSDKNDEFAMLHGLATAMTESEWKTGLEVKNMIVHIYVEPTQGYFDIFAAKGECKMGCPFIWKRDISDKMDQFRIKYKKKLLINCSHPNFFYNPSSMIDDDTPSVDLTSEEKYKHKAHVFINYKPDD